MSARQRCTAIVATFSLFVGGGIVAATAADAALGGARSAGAGVKPSTVGAITYVPPVDVWGGKAGKVIKANQVGWFHRPRGAQTPLSGQAVILQFTVKNAKKAGTITIWPVSEKRAKAPVIAFPKGNSSSSTVARVGPEHTLRFVSSETVKFHVSVFGWITGPASAQPGPGGTQVVSAFDLLNATTKGPDKVRSGVDWAALKAAGKNGIPAAGVRAVWLEVQTTSKSNATLYLSTPGHEWEDIRAPVKTHWTTNVLLARVGPTGEIAYKLSGAVKPQVRLVVVGWVAETTAQDTVSTMTGGIAPVEARAVQAKSVKVPAKYRSKYKAISLSLADTMAVPAHAPAVMMRATIKTKQAGFIKVGKTLKSAINAKTTKVRLLSNTETQIAGLAPVGKNRKAYVVLPKGAKLVNFGLEGYAVKPLALPAAPAGSVWAWGDNNHGALGYRSKADQTTVPHRVAGLRNVTSIAAARSGGRALDSAGRVWSWGWNGSGQLGDGTAYSSPVPVQVKGLPAAKAIATGATSTYAVARDGTVWAWGSNAAGRLGNGTNTDSARPVRVKNLTNITAVAVDDGTVYALDTGGRVWAWGDNTNNELGSFPGPSSNVPVQITGLRQVIQLAAGPQNGYALTADGDVYAWGANWYNQITTSAIGQTYRPTKVNGLPKIASVNSYSEGAYAVARDGTVWGWGGHNTPRHPWRVPEVDDIVQVSPYSNDLVYAVDADGSLWAWGQNTYGQLGDGTTNYAQVPRRVVGLKNVTAVAQQAGAGAYALTR